LKPSNRTLGLFVPEGKPDRAPAPVRVDAASMVRDYRGDQALASGEAFVATPANIEARTQRVTLPNEVRVAMLPKKTRGETVSLSLRLNLGDEKSLMGRSPAGGLVAAMLLRGTAHHTRQQIEDEFDRLTANGIVSADETSLVATLDTVRQHFPDALRLLLEVLRAPSFPETELEELRHTRLA